MKKVIIIGSGIAGMSSAALLAKQGFAVTVFDKNPGPGGLGCQTKEKGYTFDMGPSWYLMPEVYERYFAFFGKKPSDYYDLKKLDPYYRVYIGDTETFDIPASRDGIDAMFGRIEKDGVRKFRKYIDAAKYKYDTAMKDYLYTDYKTVFDFFRPKFLLSAPRMGLLGSMDRYVKSFFKDVRAQRILEYSTVFLGGSPMNTPSLYSLMSHVDLNLGVYYPQGGIFELMNAFHRLAGELGVQFRFSDGVSGINTEKGNAVSVTSASGTHEADIILSACDYHHTDTALLKEKDRSYSARYWKKRVMAPSAVLLYLGIKKKLPNLKHHALYLSGDWDGHFDTIFNKPSWPDDPSYYISCTSKTDPSAAPEGCENVFVLIPVASGIEDTDAVRDRYFNHIIAQLEKLTGENIRDHIEVQKMYTHRDFKAQYNNYRGTALGLAHTLFQTAIFRPSHRSKRVRNLYFAGHYTHPGIGMPMCVIGAEIMSDMITRENG